MQRDDDFISKSPKDTTLYLLSFLNRRDICQVGTTCKELNDFTDKNCWDNLLQRDFATSNVPKEFSTAKAYYIALDQEAERFVKQLMINSCIYSEPYGLRDEIYLHTTLNDIPDLNQEKINRLQELAKLWLHNVLFMPDGHLSHNNMTHLMKIFFERHELNNIASNYLNNPPIDESEIFVFNTDFSHYPKHASQKERKQWSANADFFLFNLAFLPILGCRYLLGLLLDKHPDLLHINTIGRYGYSFITQAIYHVQINIIEDLLIRMKQSGHLFCGPHRKNIDILLPEFPSATPLLSAIQIALYLYLNDTPFIIDREDSNSMYKTYLNWLVNNRDTFTTRIESIITLLLQSDLSPDERSYSPDGDYITTPLNLIKNVIDNELDDPVNIYKSNAGKDDRIQKLYSLLLQYSKQYKLDNAPSILEGEKRIMRPC